MNRFRKAWIPLAGVAAIVLVISVAGPRTAHAIVATLVQVTNTAANPAGTQDLSKTAGQIIELHCASFSCRQVFPDGSTTGAGTSYLIPTGKNLVVTSVDILPNPPGALSFPVFATLVQITFGNAFNEREKWVIPTTISTVYQFPVSGIVLGPETFPLMQFAFGNNSTLGLDNFAANLHGYLTAN